MRPRGCGSQPNEPLMASVHGRRSHSPQSEAAGGAGTGDGRSAGGAAAAALAKRPRTLGLVSAQAFLDSYRICFPNCRRFFFSLYRSTRASLAAPLSSSSLPDGAATPPEHSSAPPPSATCKKGAVLLFSGGYTKLSRLLRVTTRRLQALGTAPAPNSGEQFIRGATSQRSVRTPFSLYTKNVSHYLPTCNGRGLP